MTSWGAGSIDPDVTDLHPDGTVALQFGFLPQGVTSYRAFRFDWLGTLITTDLDRLAYNRVARLDTVSKPLKISNNGPTDLSITSFACTDTADYSVVATLPLTIPHGQSVSVQVRCHPQSLGELPAVLYARSVRTNELIACSVQLWSYGVFFVDAPSSPGSSGLSLAQSRPNPARGEVAIPFSVPRTEHVSLRIYDLSGRLAATLLDGSVGAGEHLARWDGTRGNGVKGSPGPYFYELRASGQRLRRQLVLIR